jgi:hypothetical protein
MEQTINIFASFINLSLKRAPVDVVLCNSSWYSLDELLEFVSVEEEDILARGCVRKHGRRDARALLFLLLT